MKRHISTLLFFCWLFATALAGSPALHEWLHGADAGHGNHECVVTLFASGGLDSPVAQSLVLSAPLMVNCPIVTVTESDVPGLFLVGDLSDRGPPMVSA